MLGLQNLLVSLLVYQRQAPSNTIVNTSKAQVVVAKETVLQCSVLT